MKTAWLKPLFLIGGIYDGVLGLAFLFAGARIFAFTGVTPPNHWAYLQFPALLLVLFAAMFFQIASDPVRHRSLMLYGAGLKVAYCGTVFWHELATGIPSMWIPFAWADLAFLALFLLAYRATARAG